MASAARDRRDGDVFAGLARTYGAVTGSPFPHEARVRFSRYLELLLAWNRVVRLTALRAPREIADGLFADSLLFLPRLPPRPLRVVDIGAGAGIPGVPLRIADPGIRLTLVESRRKRVSFLRALERELGIAGLSIVEGRAETAVGQIVESEGLFDVAIARAVGPAAQIVPVALSYLRPGGCFLASGPPADRLTMLPSLASWEIHDYPALGIRRAFMVARRGG